MHRLAHVKASRQVAQHIDAAGRAQRRVHALGHFIARQQVHRQQLGARQRAEVAGQRLGIAVEQHQLRALVVKAPHHGGAQLPGGTGDHDDGGAHALLSGLRLAA